MNKLAVFCFKLILIAADSQNGLTARDMDVATTIVIPTILACVILVIGMLVGIHKCRQWEADRIVEMSKLGFA